MKKDREYMRTDVVRKKISESSSKAWKLPAVKEKHSGKNNPKWKDVVSSGSAHRYIRKHMVEPEKCKCCGASRCPICGKYGIVHLCNVDHKYTKDIKDWFWACNQCHHDIDIKKGLRQGEANG